MPGIFDVEKSALSSVKSLMSLSPNSREFPDGKTSFLETLNRRSLLISDEDAENISPALRLKRVEHRAACLNNEMWFHLSLSRFRLRLDVLVCLIEEWCWNARPYMPFRRSRHGLRSFFHIILRRRHLLPGQYAIISWG